MTHHLKPRKSLTAASITSCEAQPLTSSAPTNAKQATSIPSFDQLPDSAFARASQLANNSKRPPAPVPLPFSEQTLWRKVKAGEFPAPCKFGSKTTAWNVGDVRAWLAKHRNDVAGTVA